MTRMTGGQAVVAALRAHDVEVVFGDPLYCAALTDPAEATRRIEAAVAAL